MVKWVRKEDRNKCEFWISQAAYCYQIQERGRGDKLWIVDYENEYKNEFYFLIRIYILNVE